MAADQAAKRHILKLARPAGVDICRDRAERHTASAETIKRKNARLANSSASRQLDDDISAHLAIRGQLRPVCKDELDMF